MERFPTREALEEEDKGSSPLLGNAMDLIHGGEAGRVPRLGKGGGAFLALFLAVTNGPAAATVDRVSAMHQ